MSRTLVQGYGIKITDEDIAAFWPNPDYIPQLEDSELNERTLCSIYDDNLPIDILPGIRKYINTDQYIFYFAEIASVEYPSFSFSGKGRADITPHPLTRSQRDLLDRFIELNPALRNLRPQMLFMVY